MNAFARGRMTVLLLSALISIVLIGCRTSTYTGSGRSSLTPSASPAAVASETSCPVTKPAWVKPPADPAVQGTPEPGYYYLNQDRSMWAGAWWIGKEDQYLRVSTDGIKIGWFRPAGTVLEITGRRLDGEAPPLHADIPCCYPTRFQATGLYFPRGGCWQVTAKAAGSSLSFVVWVKP